MKKTLAALLASAMLLSLAACGNPSPSGNSSSSQPSDGSSSSQPEAEKVAMTQGSWNEDGTVFTSDILGMKTPLPQDWTAATQDEILAMIEEGVGQLSEEQRKNLDLSKVANIYEFAIQDGAGVTSLMLMAENLALIPGGTAVSPELYVEALKGQLADVPGLDYAIEGTDTYTLGGKEFVRLKVSALDGVLSQWYMILRQDDIVSTFIGTFLTENQAAFEEVLSTVASV